MVDELAPKRARAAHLGPTRRRPAVLDAALEVYVKYGYRGTSMQAVAHACGVTKPVVYECFPNKDELLLALLEREQQRLRDSAITALEQAPGNTAGPGSVEAALTAFFHAAAATPSSWRAVFNAQAGADTIIAARVAQIRAELLGYLCQTTERYLRAAGVPDPTSRTPVLTEIIASMIEGCVRILISGETGWAPNELGEYAAKVLVSGAGAA